MLSCDLCLAFQLGERLAGHGERKMRREGEEGGGNFLCAVAKTSQAAAIEIKPKTKPNPRQLQDIVRSETKDSGDKLAGTNLHRAGDNEK